MITKTPGFTLPEMMLALAISGIVLLIGRGVFDAVMDGEARLRLARAVTDREVNRAQWLREAFRTLEIGGDSLGSFDGERDRVVFSARLLTGRGWSERTRVGLGVLNGKLTAVLSRGDTLELAESVAGLGFDYLLEPGERSRWVQEWRSPSTAPLAVRIRVQLGAARDGSPRADTLLLLIGERG
jgi:prepilin-type N-terminal cleavage/methylation domain-containing protein